MRFTATFQHTKCYPAMIRQLYNDLFLTELDLQSHSSYVVRSQSCLLACYGSANACASIVSAQIHVFSNNGARVLDHLLRHLEHEPDGDKLISKIRGVAFDRCTR